MLLTTGFFFFNCQTANSSRILTFYFADIYSTVRINYPYLMELERVEYIKLDLEHLFQFSEVIKFNISPENRTSNRAMNLGYCKTHYKQENLKTKL